MHKDGIRRSHGWYCEPRLVCLGFLLGLHLPLSFLRINILHWPITNLKILLLEPHSMFFLVNYLLLFATLVSARGCNIVTNLTCTSGAHIIVIRGSLEPQGPGIIGVVAQRISSRIPNSYISSLQYPAIYDPYKPSQTEGVRALTKVVKQHATLCPKTKMIILGFSQAGRLCCPIIQIDLTE